MPSRHSHLLYNDARTDLRTSQSTEGELLYRSPHGVPLVWIFAFGGRNIWNPGDDVEARGGVVGKRNPYETSIEVAVVRLEQAEQALRGEEYLWPWLSGLPILRRKLSLKPKTGYIRVAAPWVIGLSDQEIERWRSATAFAENAVNFTGAGRPAEAVAALAELQPFCPFVPAADSSDLKKFESSELYRTDDEAMRLALLTLGETDNRDIYAKAVQKDCAPALAAWRELPPRAPMAKPLPPKPDSSGPSPTAAAEAEKAGILGKLTGLFRKK